MKRKKFGAAEEVELEFDLQVVSDGMNMDRRKRVLK
jgi:hypothetical protein